MLADAIFLVLLALSTLLLQLVGLPLILAFFGKSPSQPEWWAWGRMTAWLTIGITLWLVAHLGIPANTAVGFWGVFLALGIGAYAKKSWGTRERVRRFLRTHGRAILFQELLFLFGFLFLGLVRTFHPQVLDLEKFMNAGYMQGYLRSPTLPAEDMWLAGETINYYSFGQFLGSLILRFWGVPVEIGFNALLGLMMGLVLLQSFSLSRTLLRPWLKESKKKAVSVPLLVAGLVGAALIVFGGNSHPAWYFLKHHTFEGYWYPDVTRFIEYSIHEIPAYSFVVSDYHAHFLDLPIVLCTVWVAWQWLQRLMEQRPNGWKGVLRNRSALVASLVLGALLGIMGMTNTWDMLIYGVFLGVIAGLAFVWFPHSLPALMISSVPIAVGAAITFLPWFLNFSSIVNGVFWVKERTELWQFLVLWTGHIVMTVLVAGIGGALFRKRHAPPAGFLFLMAMVFTALLFLVLPEVIYFKDIYPTYPRANTMFKFIFQSFTLMCLLAAWGLGWLAQKKTLLPVALMWFLRVVGVCFFVGVMTYPFLGYPAYYERFQERSGLDGLRWLRLSAPGDYAGIQWLRSETTGRPVVLEAVGESYTDFGRVSVFSGLPTPIGWRAHEWLWRGGFEIPSKRSEDVKLMYERPLSQEASGLFEDYAIEYIFVGTKEQEAYALDRQGLATLGPIVFQEGTTLVIHRALATD